MASVRVLIATAAIRTRFTGERPAVHDDEWDEADYLRQRAAAYLEACSLLAPDSDVVCLPAASAPPDDAALCVARCAHSGDSVWVRTGDFADLTEDQRAHVVEAAQRVFIDAAAWRRSLLPPYFARHRAWRARVGSPIQH